MPCSPKNHPSTLGCNNMVIAELPTAETEQYYKNVNKERFIMVARSEGKPQQYLQSEMDFQLQQSEL